MDLTNLHCLIRLCEKEPDEITLTLQFEIESMRRELARCITDKDLRRVKTWLKLLSKTLMCQSMPSHLQAIFNVLIDIGLIEFAVNEFMTNKVMMYIQDTSEYLISICTRAFELFPDRLSALLGLYDLLMTLVTSFHNGQGSFDTSMPRTRIKIYRAFTCLTETKCSVLRKWIKPCSLFGMDTEDISSEDNKHFTNISVVPKPVRANVLAKRQANLKGNITKGPYDSVDQYLDIHFRLLREEFMCPLREGLQQYLDSTSAEDKRQRNTSIRVYHDVRIIAPVFKKEVMFTISFKLTSWMKRINWSHSKRLLHGALICLSSDNFKTMHFATVAERDASLLRRGLIRVRFERGIKSINWTDDACYKMIETSGLFEAFRHVLRALQSMKDALPFEDYILKCRSDIEVPKYLRDKAGVKFNLTPLLEDTVCIVENKLGIHTDSDLTADRERIARDLRPSVRTMSTHFARSVDIMDYSSWPSYEQLKLDESQFRALQTSLTKELAIIQGPPGTGKSFIGLQIVKILLKNQHAWQWKQEKMPKFEWHEKTAGQSPEHQDISSNSSISRVARLTPEKSGAVDTETTTDAEESGSLQDKEFPCVDAGYLTIEDPRPILIVCYTNHALDQFLEGILQFYKGDVLRIGTRSKSSLLEKHNLSSVKRNIRLPKTLRESTRIARDETSEFRTQIASAAIESSILSKNLIHLTSLVELPLSSILKLEEAFYRWTSRHESHCRHERYTEILEPSLTVIWLDLFGKLNEIARKQKHRIKRRVRKPDENAQANGTLDICIRSKLYDLTKEDPATVENIRAGLFCNVAYSPKIDDGCEVQKELAQYVKDQLECTDMMTDEEVQYFSDDITILSLDQRWRMYRRFVENQQRTLEQDVKIDLIKLEKANAKQKELALQGDKVVMKNARIIGMTTTCAAKYHAVLNEVKPRIIIIEEAAEVLESHILSCLNPFCEQLILIGDHQQLRPKVETYDLVHRYHLDVSLFERMIKNGIHYECLQRQHRMRPVIANVIRHIYTTLEDDESVNRYPNIGGIAQNLFCISHGFAETYEEEQKSYSNEYEARFAVSLANYVMQQGYDASMITVLTTYKGQLFLLKRLLKEKHMDCVGLTVSVVDNYQGEENDIVILSLVRSNENRKIGFLKKANRICVALSRAKMGLYMIGDLIKLAQSSELWRDIMSDLRTANLIGNSLPLYCQNHRTEKVFASSCEDFEKVPDGGCSKPCEWRLDCGHVCERKCHIVDSSHEGIVCTKPCIRRCKNGHRCKRSCDRPCGNCSETIQATLKCGHTNAIPCYRIEPYTCKAICNRKLDCGHVCTKPCRESCSPCGVTYKASLVRCKHEVDIVCGVSDVPLCQLQCSLNLECGHKCTEPCKNIHTASNNEVGVCCDLGHRPLCIKGCETILACEHRCNGTCSSCFGERLHLRCNKRCNCDLACGHGCEGMCGECFPCERTCENSCPHSCCNKRCKEPCQKCEEPCEWECVHFKCTKSCGEICDRPRCDQRCDKRLTCGHKCLGLCGERCPKQCFICNEDFLKKIQISGNKKNPPCVVQLEECQHIIEYRQMDGYMDQKDSVIRLKRCPVCEKPIRRSKRYGNVVKEILGKIEKLKKDAVDADEEDNAPTTKIALNIKNIQTCLKEIDDYFGTDSSSIKDRSFMETILLGDRQLHSANAFPKKQFVLDISLEVKRRFDHAFLQMLQTRLSSDDSYLDVIKCIKATSSQIEQRKRYDTDIQDIVKEIIEKIRGEYHGVRPALMEVNVTEADPNDREDNKDKHTVAEVIEEENKDTHTLTEMIIEENKDKYNTTEMIVEENKDKNTTTEMIVEENKDKYNTTEMIVEENKDKCNTTEMIVEQNKDKYTTTEMIVEENKDKYNTIEMIVEENKDKYTTTEMIVEENKDKYTTTEMIVEENKDKYNTTEMIVEENKDKYNTTEMIVEENKDKYNTTEMIVEEAKDKFASADRIGGGHKDNYPTTEMIGEDKKDNYTAGDMMLDIVQARAECNQEDLLTDTALDQPRIFHLQLYIQKDLLYYKCGKSQMEKSTGHIPPAGPDDDESSGRKEGYSDHSKEHVRHITIPQDQENDGYVERAESLKRKHTRDDTGGGRYKIKKLTMSLKKEPERRRREQYQSKTDKRKHEQRKRKHVEPNVSFTKKRRIDKEWTDSGRSNDDNDDDDEEDDDDDDDQKVIESLLKRDDGKDAVVQSSDCIDSRNIEQHRTLETNSRQRDRRNRDRNSRKTTPHSSTSNKNNTRRGMDRGSSNIKHHGKHGVSRKLKDGGYRRERSTQRSPRSISSHRIKDEHNHSNCERGFSPKEGDLRFDLSEKRKRSDNVNYEEGKTKREKTSLSETLVFESTTEKNTNVELTTDMSIDCRRIIDGRRKSKSQKTSDIIRFFNNKHNMDDNGINTDDAKVLDGKNVHADGYRSANKGPKKKPTAVDKEISPAKIDDLRVILNNSETKSADLRQFIDKARNSKKYECSSRQNNTLDHIRHQTKAGHFSEDLYSSVDAKCTSKGKNTNWLECNDTRRVTTTSLDINKERDLTANSSMHLNTRYRDNASNGVQNERAVIKYDDLFGD